jgi:hypothetical protein
MLQYNPTVSGSLIITGSLTVTNGVIGTVSGVDIQIFSSSINQVITGIQSSTGSSDAKFETLGGVTSSALTRLTNIETKSASVDISISNINSVTASNIARLSNLETKSSSVDISITNINSFTASNANTSLNTYTGSNDTKFTTLATYTGSLDTKNTTLSSVTSSLISKTGSYATTGSNSFYGTQVFSGSVYIANDLVVQGSSSIQYISASSVSIGTNIVQLNTANPSVRFAGLTMIDSGSVGGSGSFLYDSREDEFLFVHRGNGTNVTSSHFIMGPETFDNLGNETYLTCNIITKGTGKEHLVDSCIFDNGTTTCIKNNLIGTGTACFGSVTSGGNICTSYVSLSNSYPNITFLQNSIGNVVTTGANDIAFRPNDAEKMRITNCGYVGIGTNCPTGYLNISTATPGQNEPHIRLTDSSTSGNGGNVYISADKTGVGYNNLTMLAFSYTFKGGASATNYLTIDTSGISCFKGTVCAPTLFASTAIFSSVYCVNSYNSLSSTTSGQMGVLGHNAISSQVTSNTINQMNSGYYGSFIRQYYNEGITFYTRANAGTAGDVLYGTSPVADGGERLRITSTGIACFACQVCVKSLTTTSGGVSQIQNGVRTQTFFAYKLINENSTANFFRITTSGASSTHTQLIASNAGVGWHTSQIYHASNAGYWGGYIGSGASISITNGSAGYISGIYSDNAGAQNYCVTVASNGTSTQSLVVAYITVVLADGYGVTFTQL